MKTGIYFDNNATTRVAPEVVEAMLPYFREEYGNPSSPHGFARQPALAVSAARDSVARLIGARADQVVFTSGGTESNVMASWGWLSPSSPRNEVVVSAVEHASVWAWRDRLAAAGYTVRVVPVNRAGALDLEAFGGMISERIALVSVMLANNETGVIYPLKRITEMAHAVGAKVHTDAVQAVGKIPLNLTSLGVDSAALCGHKYHASKGIGALYLRDTSGFAPLWVGGEQEFGRRPGTEPVALVAGLGCASNLAEAWLIARGADAMANARDALEAWMADAISDVVVLGKTEARLPNTSMVLIRGVETEPLLALLDMEGIACSSGSACASGAHEVSHVVRAMGWADEAAAVLRISASRYTQPGDYDRLREVLPTAIARLRGTVSSDAGG
jgi:cysteine desulfurase